VKCNEDAQLDTSGVADARSGGMLGQNFWAVELPLGTDPNVKQRVTGPQRGFTTGYRSGDLGRCDTFATDNLG
jgi:hypothetical protein